MHHARHLITYSFWGTSVATQLGIACFMLRNGSRQKFPRFFYYCLFGALQSLILWAITAWGTYPEYFYFYYGSAVLGAALGFLVIQEIFLISLSSMKGLKELGKIAFRWAAALMLLIAILVGMNAQGSGVMAMSKAVNSLESSFRLMEIGLLLLLFLVSSKLGLSFKSRTFGIALGMGSMAAVNLFCFTLLANSTVHLLLINQIRAGFGILTAVTWLTYFALPAAQESPVMVPIASPLMRWNEIALAFGHPAGRVVYTDSSEPFLPQVERMVDRIFESGEMKG